jgi:hypothetical protein
LGAAEKFKKIHEEEEKHSKLEEIYNLYLSETSKFQVNVHR